MKGRKEAPMPAFTLNFGAGFVLLASLMYLLDDSGLVSAVIPCVAIHELGHLLALIILGNPPRALNAGLSGFSIDYAGKTEGFGRFAAALAGPLSGIAFALLCARLGAELESPFLIMTAGVSCGLSLFNLLPVYPLDGGLALSAVLRAVFGGKAERAVMLALGILLPMGMIFAGLYILKMPAPAAAGAWLLINNLLEAKGRTKKELL